MNRTFVPEIQHTEPIVTYGVRSKRRRLEAYKQLSRRTDDDEEDQPVKKPEGLEYFTQYNLNHALPLERLTELICPWHSAYD